MLYYIINLFNCSISKFISILLYTLSLFCSYSSLTDITMLLSQQNHCNAYNIVITTMPSPCCHHIATVTYAATESEHKQSNKATLLLTIQMNLPER